MLKLRLKYFIFIFCFFIPFKIFSQDIYGRVYVGKDIGVNVTITNTSLGLISFSNDEGDFKIKAHKNDSISFTSIFCIKKIIRVDSIHLKGNFIIQLKEKITSLDEVIITGGIQKKKINPDAFNKEFNNLIKDDIINNPSIYEKQSNGNINFIKIGKNIINLLKKKGEESKFTPIIYYDLEILFQKNKNIFNENLLVSTLQIPKDSKSLFFDYCESKQINAKLLIPENTFLLLDELVQSSIDFKIIYCGN